MERSYDDTASLPRPSGIVAIPPQAFGKYTLVARIGRGGMADILLAIASGPSGFRKLVVIKRLREAYEDVRQIVDLFVDEARLGARLEHPNVVHTLDHGVVERQHFLAVEYLEGHTLARTTRRLLREKKEVPLPFLLQVTCDVLDALHYAHELTDFDGSPLGVVHRDVSPSNVIITYHGTVKLLDFGVAKSATQLTGTDPEIRKGKFAYLSPEQLEGTVDRRSDLFSLGIVLWEALTGKRLFFASDPAQTIKKVTELPIPGLSKTAGRVVPLGLEALVKRALHRIPKRRFQTAAQMRAAIEKVAADEGIVLSRRRVAEVMATTFADLREAHANDIRNAVEAGLETATARFEVLAGVGKRIELVDVEGVPKSASPPPPPTKPQSGVMPLPRGEETQEIIDDDIVFEERISHAGGKASRRTIAVAIGAVAAALVALVALGIVASTTGGGDEPETDVSPPAERAPEAPTQTANVPAPEPEVETPTEEPAAPAEAEAAPGPAGFDRGAFELLRADAREHYAAGRFAESAHAYEAATLMDPTHSGSYAGLGASHLAAGDADRAIAAYEEAVRLDPLHSGYRAALGRAYRADRRYRSAIEAYREAIDLDPHNAAATEALRELTRRRRRHR